MKAVQKILNFRFSLQHYRHAVAYVMNIIFIRIEASSQINAPPPPFFNLVNILGMMVKIFLLFIKKR